MKIDGDTFLTKSKFSAMVQETVQSLNITYMDAIIHLCEKNNLEVEDMRKYISPVIKDKLEAEAMQLNLIPRQAELPFDLD